ncbi:MAG TPA: hypothetical protein ENK35_03095 [Candidatus Tenderia sp.]|nr:hypothetical protein [Candidatus Tenderia sp.]
MNIQDIIKNLHQMGPELDRRYHHVRALLVELGDGKRDWDVELDLAVNDLTGLLDAISPAELDD